MKKNNFKVALSYLALIIGVFVVIMLFLNNGKPEEIKYSDVVNYFREDAVVEFTVDDSDYLQMKVHVLIGRGLFVLICVQGFGEPAESNKQPTDGFTLFSLFVGF